MRSPPPSLNLSLPEGEALINNALADPSNIDETVNTLLTVNPAVFKTFHRPSYPEQRPCLAAHLFQIIYEYICRGVTPELQWGGDPSRPSTYYHGALLYSTLLGRAFAITRETIDEFADPSHAPEAVLEQSEQLWWVISYTFILAFLSGQNPEPGARYCGAILVLCAGNAIERAGVTQKGKGQGPWSDELSDPDTIWDFKTLKEAVMETKHLPQHNHDVKELRERWEKSKFRKWHEYVSQEELDALYHARDKLGHPEREDFTSQQIMEVFASYLATDWQPDED